MHYLIDGHNLIAQLKEIELGDPNDEVKLILMLRSWTAADRKRRVTLYFDGGLPGGKSRELSQGQVAVIFASAGRKADELLIQHIKSVKPPGAYTLITGDQQIVAWARQRKMPVQSAAEFAQRLEKEQQERLEALRVDEGTDPVIAAGEVEEWLALFGPEPASAPPPPPPRRMKAPATPEKPPAPPRPPAELKTSGDLTAEELSAWLELFSPSGDE